MAREFVTKLGQDAIRATVYGVVILLLLVGATAVAGNTQAESVKYQKAIACELAVPSSPDTGRDPALVGLCFTNEGLLPPTFVGDRS